MSDDVFGDIAADGRAHLPPRTDEGAGVGLGAIPEYPVEVLPVAARSLVACGVEAGLPAALLGGAVLAAMSAAIGPAAQIEVIPTWHERAILWIPLLALGAPARARLKTWRSSRCAPTMRNSARTTTAARCCSGIRPLRPWRAASMARRARLIDLDELAVLLRGIGEYKRGARRRPRPVPGAVARRAVEVHPRRRRRQDQQGQVEGAPAHAHDRRRPAAGVARAARRRRGRAPPPAGCRTSPRPRRRGRPRRPPTAKRLADAAGAAPAAQTPRAARVEAR